MKGLLFARQRQEIEELSQSVENHRRILAKCVRKSKKRLADRIGSPLGLALAFEAGFFSTRLSGKVPNKKDKLSSIFRFGSKAAFTLF